MYPYNKRPRTTSDTDEDEGDQYGYSDYTLAKHGSSGSLWNEEDRDSDKGRATVRKRKLALDDDEEGVIKKKPPTYSDFSMKMMVFKPFIHFIDMLLFIWSCFLYTSILIHVSICYLFIYPFHRLVWAINLVWVLG